MAMTVPGDPFAVAPAITKTEQFGLVEHPAAKYSEKHALAGIETAASFIEGAAQQWVREQEDTRVADLSNKLQRFTTNLRDNPETGYSRLLGENAIIRPNGLTLRDEMLKEYDAFTSELMKSAGSDNVKKRFKGQIEASRFRLESGVNAHVVTQSELYRQAVNHDRINLAADMALNGKDEEEVAGGEETLKALAEAEARRRGLPVDYSATLGRVRLLRIEAMVDDTRLTAAQQLAKADKFMSAEQKRKALQMIKTAKKRVAVQRTVDRATDSGINLFSSEAIVGRTVRDSVGKESTPEQIKQALDLAGGDQRKAVAILAYGPEQYMQAAELDRQGAEGTVDGELKNSEPVQQALQYFDATDQWSYGAVFKVVKEKYSKLSDAQAAKVTQAILKERTIGEQARRQELNDSISVAMKMVENGGAVPESLRQKLPPEVLQGLNDYSTRREAGALVTDWGLYWDCLSHPDRLKNMSLTELASVRGRLTEDDYAAIVNYRNGLQSGQFKQNSVATIRNKVVSVMKAMNITPKAGKQNVAFGFILRGIVDRALIQSAQQGAPLDDSQIEGLTQELLSTELQINEDWSWGMNEKTLKEVISDKGLDPDKDLVQVLDAGLAAGGNYMPSAEARTEILLSLAITPNKPIVGVEGMLTEIERQAPGFVEQYRKAFDAKHPGVEPTPNRIVRAYLDATKLFR